jgi:prepilin peptidase CpaA
MLTSHSFPTLLHENWPVWLLSLVLVIAAVIDGWKLKVPNWITFPLVLGGWAYSGAVSAGKDWAGACWERSSA